MIDHPVKWFSRTIVFPKERPCRTAVLETGAGNLQLPVHSHANGKTSVRIDISAPRPNVSDTVRWSW